MKTVLTIAGFDPSSGAGISADLKVFAAHGLYGTACITALTVQNTLGVAATYPVATDTIAATLQNLYADLPPAGIKIGMLATAEAVSEVVDFLRLVSVPVVLDPVLKSTSGAPLLDKPGIDRLRNDLLPLVSWVTPNVEELAVLVDRTSISAEDLITAAAEIQQCGRELTIVVTGGHHMPPNDLVVLPNSRHVTVFGEHIASSATHGTGCAFSSALLSRIVLGDEPIRAAIGAKSYVASAIRLAEVIGHGSGPLNHLWPLQDQDSL